MSGEKGKAAAGSAAEASSEPVSSKNRTPKTLKPNSKIVKKSNNFGKITKFKATPQVQVKKNKKKRSVLEGSNESSSSDKGDEKKPSLKQMKLKGIAHVEHSEKGQHKTKGKLGQKKQSQKRDENPIGLEKGQMFQMNKEKHIEVDKNLQKQGKREDKLGGLIFMCSAKTKPDCFRYRVMGVTMSKKDLVLGVKPGLKLFLYDFDLKLMYGIYEASSSGGLKLEPTAFDGAFPVQVRFNVYQDCYPLPESVFRKAIEENYNEKNKFKTELTVKQVKKLRQLFRPAEIHSKAPDIHVPTLMTIHDREVYEGVKESWHQSHREPLAREHHTYDEVRRYNVMSHENGQHLSYREIPLMDKAELSRDSFPSEQEYRTYGLCRERHNLTPAISHVAPGLDPYPRGHQRQNLSRQPSTVYREVAPAPAPAPAPGEFIRHGPLLLDEREYNIFGVSGGQELQNPIPRAITATAATIDSHPNYPYSSSQYVTSSMQPYPRHLRREEIPLGSYSLSASKGIYPVKTDGVRSEDYLTDAGNLGRRGIYPAEAVHFGRRENDNVERLYSTHNSNAVSNSSQVPRHPVARPEPSNAPVSSRYSFPGLSMSYL